MSAETRKKQLAKAAARPAKKAKAEPAKKVEAEPEKKAKEKPPALVFELEGRGEVECDAIEMGKQKVPAFRSRDGAMIIHWSTIVLGAARPKNELAKKAASALLKRPEADQILKAKERHGERARPADDEKRD